MFGATRGGGTCQRRCSLPSELRRVDEVVVVDDLSDVLSEFARTMVTDFPIQGILDHLVKRIVDIMPITGAGVTLISPGSEPRYVAASSDSALRYERLQTELGEGPCVAAYLTGEAVLVPDLNDEDRFPRFAARALDAGLIAVFTFPLNHDASQLGALDLYCDTTGPLSPDFLGAAQTLADVAAAYVLNAEARAELQDASVRSSEAALHDSLTGLPNRALMLERLEHAFTRGARTSDICAVLFVDLDRFKRVNDTYGHQVGDELLIAVAERLLTALRPSDTLARMSGDEFVLLCEDLDDPSRAHAIADRVDAALVRPFALSGSEVRMTASIGIAFTGRGSNSPMDLIRNADLAMYQSKRKNAGQRQMFNLGELHLAGDEDGLEQFLLGAATRGELCLVYQPIVHPANGRVIGAEALLRWTHPRRGEIPPNVVIPLAEQTAQIDEIGRWVLEQACAERTSWPAARANEVSMSVNISAHQFMSAGFAAMVADVLANASIDPRFLTLDITESVFVQDGERALIVLNNLKDMGVQIALDDFGAGTFSVSDLVTYPVETVKIDPALIAGLAENPANRTIVTAVIQLAHGLGMTVVSEGVETLEQHGELARLGCDACQGFYYSRPIPATSFDSLIERGTEKRNLALAGPEMTEGENSHASPGPDT
jgi:diguanylate cyclase (GGDEF)-like protein